MFFWSIIYHKISYFLFIVPLTVSVIGIFINSFFVLYKSLSSPVIFGVGPGIDLSITKSAVFSIAYSVVVPMAALLSSKIKFVTPSFKHLPLPSQHQLKFLIIQEFETTLFFYGKNQIEQTKYEQDKKRNILKISFFSYNNRFSWKVFIIFYFERFFIPHKLSFTP